MYCMTRLLGQLIVFHHRGCQMLIASIPVYNEQQADTLIMSAKNHADALELRLDYWQQN